MVKIRVLEPITFEGNPLAAGVYEVDIADLAELGAEVAAGQVVFALPSKDIEVLYHELNVWIHTALTNSGGAAFSGNEVQVSDYAHDLADAIADNTGADDVVLAMTADYTLEGDLTVPANIRIRSFEGAQIINAGHRLEFEGYGLVDPMSETQLFSGFTASEYLGAAYGTVGTNLIGGLSTDWTNALIGRFAFFPNINFVSEVTGVNNTIQLTIADNLPETINSSYPDSIIFFDLRFSGSSYPKNIQAALFGGSVSESYMRADAALAGKSANIKVETGTITGRMHVTKEHSLEFGQGLFDNTALVEPSIVPYGKNKIYGQGIGITDVKESSGILDSAQGKYLFIANPANNDTVLFNGVTFTFITGASSGTNINIKASLELTLAEAISVLNASTDPLINVATYSADGTNKINIVYDTAGNVGKTYTLGTFTANIWRTNTTLAGAVRQFIYSYGAAVYPFDGESHDITVCDMTISGQSEGIGHESSRSAVLLGNGANPTVERVKFYYTHSFGAYLGLFGTRGYTADNGYIRDCIFQGLGTQNAGCLSCRNCHIINNKFYDIQPYWFSPFAGVIDIEPNDTSDQIDGIIIAGNQFYGHNATVNWNAIIVQRGAAEIARGVSVQNNLILGSPVAYGGSEFTRYLSNGIQLSAIDGGIVSGNFVVGASQSAWSVNGCKDIRLVGNYGLMCGGGGIQGGQIVGCFDCEIEFNTLKNTDSPVNQNNAFSEEPMSGTFYSTSGDVMFLPIAYKFWIGQKIEYSGTEYTIVNQVDHQHWTLSPTPPALGAGSYTFNTRFAKYSPNTFRENNVYTVYMNDATSTSKVIPKRVLNYSATAAPGVNDDISLGYEIGSEWFDTVGNDFYKCVDNTDGAAVWIQLTVV